MEELSEHELTEIIYRFKSILQQDGKSNDVEYFLNNKAIRLEKVGASTTYLVFDQTINLLGQIGRNFNDQHTIKGQDLLTLAYKKLQEACMIVGST